MLHSDLEGGKCDNVDKNLRQETKNASNTNCIAENNFWVLERLRKEKLNCNRNVAIITFETIIMRRNNKAYEWIENLTLKKRSLMMKWSCESTAKEYDDFRNNEIEKKVYK